jgi:signal transduction histidine kinase/CheY-like chemotaxis protein
MITPLFHLTIADEQDVVAARQRARQTAGLLGFDTTDQTRLATAVSEIARNAFLYAGGGRVTFEIEGIRAPQVLTIHVSDTGGGIANLQEILSGRYTSSTGLGLGIVGARRLMDVFEASSSRTGTTISMKKLLPPRAPLVGPSELARLASALAAARPAGPLVEVREQNQELLRTLEALQKRQEELEEVNRELEDTNRGVVALYAELDERADHLRRVDEVKTRFLSNMTHEFRTPVNSILALTNLLSERLQVSEADKDEVYYIRRSAVQLSELIDDLLDLAKVEAGKIEVSPTIFEVRDLFGALRGMLRPLLVNDALSLVFEDNEGLPPICSDERKVSQILRNLVSNALKYTERGEVRVTARLTGTGNGIELSVADTGIGIPEADLDKVFDEFVQIENPLQRRVKGTGLGLPLSKRLAELLGGTISVSSTFGLGSTFTVTLPLMPLNLDAEMLAPDPNRLPVLVVDDDEADLMIYERAFNGTRFQMVPARSAATAIKALEVLRPSAIVLDIRLHGEESWDLLTRLRQQRATADVPVVVVSSVDDRHKAIALGANVYHAKPIDPHQLLDHLNALVAPSGGRRILVIDDQDTFRYIMREMLRGPGNHILEPENGRDGLQKAARANPDVILLDLHLGDVHGLDVIEALRRSPQTAHVPVVVVTSTSLSDADRERLPPEVPVLSKAHLTRELVQEALERSIDHAMAQAHAPAEPS